MKELFRFMLVRRKILQDSTSTSQSMWISVEAETTNKLKVEQLTNINLFLTSSYFLNPRQWHQKLIRSKRTRKYMRSISNKVIRKYHSREYLWLTMSKLNYLWASCSSDLRKMVVIFIITRITTKTKKQSKKHKYK